MKKGQAVWEGNEHPSPRTQMESGGPLGGDVMEGISTQFKFFSCLGSQWLAALSGDHPHVSWAAAVSETLQAPSGPRAFGSDMPSLGFLPGFRLAAPELDSIPNLFTWSLERGGICLFSASTSGTLRGKLGKVASVWG